MKKVWLSSVLVLCLLLIIGSHGMAADFRCGSKIITVGNYRYDVLRRCGEPAHVETWEEVRFRRDFGPGLFGEEKVLYLRPQLVEELVTIEEWEYNLGPNTFIRYLRFENGRLTRINDGDYGY